MSLLSLASLNAERMIQNIVKRWTIFWLNKNPLYKIIWHVVLIVCCWRKLVSEFSNQLLCDFGMIFTSDYLFTTAIRVLIWFAVSSVAVESVGITLLTHLLATAQEIW